MKKRSIAVILHNIRSAYNVGSIFRTADGAGVNKIYLCGYTPTPARLNLDKISKTALGAEKYVPWEYCRQTWRLLEKLKKDKIKIVALEQSSKAIDYRKFNPPLGNGVSKWITMALVVGNEVRGLSKEILKHCDEVIEIPMRGKKESLNVSVATGVVLYEITKQNS